MTGRSKQTPTVVDTGLGEEPKALTEASLNAGEADGPPLLGELVFGS